MTEEGEIRRSSRSTKGRNRRLEEEAELEAQHIAVPHKKPRAKRAKAVKDQQQDNGQINCICGHNAEEGEKLMAECEKCLKWQHVECLLGENDESIVPDGYLCQECDPEGKTRVKREKSETSIDASSPVSIHIPTKQKSQEPESIEEHKSKRQSTSGSRLVSHSQTTPPAAPTDKVRTTVVNALNGIFANLIAEAIKNGDFALPENTSVTQYAEQLSNQIEQALYNNLANKPPSGPRAKPVDVGAKYRDKFRALSFNLKDEKNLDLRVRVVTGKISADSVVLMSTEEMRNPELRKLAESVRKESIRDSVLVVDEARRIRKTHKGEEVVGDEDFEDLDADKTNKRIEETDSRASRSGSEGADANVNGASEVGGSSSSRSNRPSASDFFEPESDRLSVAEYDQYSNNMDVIGYSPSASPRDNDDHDGPGFLQLEDDEDLDDIIAEKDPKSSASIGTSAATLPSGDIAIWTGHVSMVGVAQFPGNAKHLSGGNIGKGFNPNSSWSEVINLTAPIVIDGRLDKARASKYLKDVQASKDIVSFILGSDEQQSTKPEFDKLYEYFAHRNKYGVIKHRKSIVKDAYIVPVEKDNIPDHLGLTAKQEDILKAKLAEQGKAILGVFVVPPFKGSPVSDVTPPPHSNGIPAPSVSGVLGTLGINANGLSSQPATTVGLGGYVAPPYSTTGSSNNNVLASLGLSNKDVELLQGVLSAHPEVASNPSLPNNPQLLLSILQQAAQGGIATNRSM